ncbi:hypothetical protein BN1708_002265 [Verticillium longisporum]|uniref:Uncharacterized protein n=1 Tax=Verticillium longisporum TaxID=100787 RepID=A0A0G4KMI6_VERLO|nr:hypothetical protein BN1708_002265 [Verticillium longisporum]
MHSSQRTCVATDVIWVLKMEGVMNLCHEFCADVDGVRLKISATHAPTASFPAWPSVTYAVETAVVEGTLEASSHG